MPGARTSYSLSFSRGELVQRVELQRAAADERLVEAAVEHQVLGDGQVADQAVDLAVLGDEADAGVEDPADRAADELVAVEPDRPGDVVLEAQQRLGELGLAVALHAGDGEHLAALDA